MRRRGSEEPRGGDGKRTKTTSDEDAEMGGLQAMAWRNGKVCDI